jgi:hypothetical protein
MGEAKPYTQVKVSVCPDIALAFKNACACANQTMVAVLSQFMGQYAKTVTVKNGYAPDLSSRRQRRAAVRSVIHQLERVRDGEENYRENIPDNLQGSSVFDKAEQCVAILDEALELLESAY